MGALDDAYGQRAAGQRSYRFEGDMTPTDFFRRSVFISFQEDDVGIRMRDGIGVDALMWGSDYPHPDCIWPESQDFIQRNLGQLDERVRLKVVRENAGKLYGFLK